MVDEVLECPVDAFLEHYAPFEPPPEFVAAARDKLVGDFHLKQVQLQVGGHKVWTLAPYTEPPRSSKKREPIVFKPLEGLIRSLEGVEYADESGVQRDCLSSYKDTPASKMASEIKGTNFKVDALITSDPKAEITILSDVVAVAEFKKKYNCTNVRDVSSECTEDQAVFDTDLFSLGSHEANLSSCPDHERRSQADVGIWRMFKLVYLSNIQRLTVP